MGRWTQSLVSFNDTLWYFGSEKKKRSENFTDAYWAKPNLSCPILVLCDMWLDPCHITATRSTIQNDKGGKQKWVFPSSLWNLYIICPKACLPFLPTQPQGSCIHHLSHDSAVAKHFYNEMPVRWQIRPLSYLSVSGFAPWKLEAWIQSTWQLSQAFLWSGRRKWKIESCVSQSACAATVRLHIGPFTNPDTHSSQVSVITSWCIWH